MADDAPDNPNAINIAPGLDVPAHLLRFTFARSSGPGGQNVNKVNSKAILEVDVPDLEPLIGVHVAARLRRLAGQYHTADDRLVIPSEESRSQHANRHTCIEKLRDLIVRARVQPKRRKKTKPSRGAKERRIKAKKERGEIKKRRGEKFD
ncbi:MAG: aminoacyl-tRNA hydrolase [Phycisphaera sp.]|nr:aminoacyl-tRNA hydrolase [Phycisphaera sp.]